MNGGEGEGECCCKEKDEGGFGDEVEWVVGMGGAECERECGEDGDEFGFESVTASEVDGDDGE